MWRVESEPHQFDIQINFNVNLLLKVARNYVVEYFSSFSSFAIAHVSEVLVTWFCCIIQSSIANLCKLPLESFVNLNLL